MVNTYRQSLVRDIATPQRQEAPTVTPQVQNNAGGFVFAVDKWSRLNRFLIIGTEGGTFYQSADALTRQNSDNVLACIKEDGPRVVNLVSEISNAGRAVKNDPALLVLSLVLTHGNAAAKKLAFDAIPVVARTGTHWLHLASFIDGSRGWGRGMRKAWTNMFNSMNDKNLVYQMLKYANRDGWTMRDLLRVTHPKPETSSRQSIYKYITRGVLPTVDNGVMTPDAHKFIAGVELIKTAPNANKAAAYISEYRLPREVVPTAYQKADVANKAVWNALADEMGYIALLRNLNKLTLAGVIAPLSPKNVEIAARLMDEEAIRRSRVHPMTILMGMKQYAAGYSGMGSRYGSTLAWRPEQTIIDALNRAFYTAFGAVPSTGKATLLAIDVSGSMDANVSGFTNLSCREAAAAIALVTANAEPNHFIGGFTGSSYAREVSGTTWSWERYHAMQAVRRGPNAIEDVSGFEALNLSPHTRLDAASRYLKSLRLGPTDCALPMLWARKQGIVVDTFIILTDNETWHGAIHPFQALELYRRDMNPNARLAVMAMTASPFTIANPDDSGMLDLVGLDSAAPQVLAEFSAGNI